MAKARKHGGKAVKHGTKGVQEDCPECCDPVVCPWYWKATLCRLGPCPLPAEVFFCEGYRCSVNARKVVPGDIIKAPGGGCYLVSGVCKWYKDDPPDGECKIPLGAIILEESEIHGCFPSCDDPGCFPNTYYYPVRPCPCTPNIDVSQYMVACTDYWGWRNQGVICPTALLPIPGCASVDTSRIVQGLQRINLSAETCCNCCERKGSAFGCTEFLAKNVQYVNGALVSSVSRDCCCSGTEAGGRIVAAVDSFIRPDLFCGGQSGFCENLGRRITRSGRHPGGLCSYHRVNSTVRIIGDRVEIHSWHWVTDHYEECIQTNTFTRPCELKHLVDLTGFTGFNVLNPMCPASQCGNGNPECTGTAQWDECNKYVADFQSGSLVCDPVGGSDLIRSSFRVSMRRGATCQSGCKVVPVKDPDGGLGPDGFKKNGDGVYVPSGVVQSAGCNGCGGGGGL